ncbi:terpenoid cyclases/protein prenyltransferase alpha-alpha toroid [Fusarium oxysporum II5]|uniref:Geranylgeranyl transferase type-1 subunit beta n=1 Tax=Fusarium odoratissimum (strain NRRL 54006) TaxID=1089451 RepID=X0J1L0_FUSO5|nr:protein farnesyltransferase/geranylgeranyltransferase type-1 subunit alpha [Fusarium odoratissimum NRRL 54006]EXL95022.1 protein farnesyltransferase/geranylgeranyltransferase type-1 subunit alpha [Fusarium odoratissimum NRRL 54006]KAK2135890.1 terpenoid cyclases/protein prenyltransferase alpha-alpha toroid [Fusarium oxysporum II5]
MSEAGSSLLDKQQHIKYWQRCHKSYLPSPYTAYDSTRLTFACFIISALDILSVPLTHTERGAIRRWVLSLQHPEGGFCGSSTHALPGQEAYKGTANIAATFFALVLLGLAADGEDEARSAFNGVDRVRLLKWLNRLQRKDGSFGQNLWDGEIVGGRDMRHSYLASCIRWMLRGDVKEGDEGWVEDLNVDEMIAHIKRGQTYDGGVAESSQHESHAGYAYCAIGALSLLDRPLDSTSPHPPEEALKRGVPDREGLLHFLASRSFAYLAKEEEEDEVEENFLESKTGEFDLGHIGFNGRWNKKADTCYCWWVGGTLAMLGNSTIINVMPSRRYLLDITQHRIGGFSKSVGGPPDMYHSYLGLAALATMGDGDLKEFDVGLCCSQETTRKIQKARDGLIDSTRGNRKAWCNDGFW